MSKDDDDPVTVDRDPFGRFSIVRRIVRSREIRCSWCGKSSMGRLFQYGVDHDGGRLVWETRSFCSKSCRDTFNGR